MADLTCEVSFKGVASPGLQAAFVEWELATGGGLTRVRCAHGGLQPVLARIEELGLELLDVRLIAEHPRHRRPGPTPTDHPPAGDDTRR